ncbi:hypothetical protein L1987_61547 [Smallanthus sonchifolius]|uniref:Uncharacterized protein n=1 Tax=Smallanthus sonchifolius TaxID=185202 RepID=A0ACB9C874_9ASTR|nr:hypothetical protein L1987_61547 [Smallanthus sonchifolius]
MDEDEGTIIATETGWPNASYTDPILTRILLTDLHQLKPKLWNIPMIGPAILVIFSDDVHLSQQRYLHDLQQRAGLSHCSFLSTPVSIEPQPSSCQLGRDDHKSTTI